MNRFNVDAYITGTENSKPIKVLVSFGIECGHIVLFHDIRRWDDDCKAKLGLSSGRKRRCSSDLGAWSQATATNEQLAQAVKDWRGFDVVFDDADNKPTTTEKPLPKPELKQTQRKPFDASQVASQTTANGASAQDAIATLFGGIQNEITQNVLTAIEPYINTIHRTELVVTSDLGTHVTEGIFHERFQEILEYVNNGDYVYMYGPAGSGKSYIGKQIADALGLDYYEQQRVTHDYQLLGWPTANGGWVETPFFNAFTKGGLFNWDECDGSCPESGLCVNDALEQGFCVFGSKVYKRHPNFRLVASGNTNGQGATEEYVGRFCQDAAFFDRLLIVDVDYCPELERALCNNDVEILDFARQVRRVREEKHINVIVGNRLIKRLYKYRNSKISADRILKVNIFNRLDPDTARILFSSLPDYGGKWFDAAKVLAKSL